VTVLGIIAAVTPLVGRQQPALPAAIDVDRLGPQVGDPAPLFALQDQHGRTRALSSLLGPKGAMLVFYRSADWCPYCKGQLVELQRHATDLQRDGLTLVAVSYDPVPVLAAFSTRMQIGFPLLSDPGSATIKRYGILNTTIDATNPTYGIPFPGTFLIDAHGVVTSRFFETAYQERDTTTSILARLGRHLDVPIQKISAPHLAISAFTTDQVATSGTHFSLVLDIAPAPHVHVYAPGAADYKVVALTIRPMPGLVVRRATFPKADDYFFAPLKEHVAVYQKPFRILQDVMIDPSPAGTAALKEQSSLTITATLDYQACDDTVCFIPQSVPLAWTVSLRALDRVRATQP